MSALALGAGPATAKIVELGQTASPVSSPVCPKGVSPASCYIILTRTTAVQTVSDGVSNPTTVKRNGWVVAFTVGLSRLSSKASTERTFLHELDQAYGGTPQLAITVLKPGRKHTFKVTAESASFHLIPFLGQVLQEPLSMPPNFTQFTSLPVKAGDVIALTIPTWAPVLSYNLNTSRFAYRQSRAANCKNAAASETAQRVGETGRYLCNYTGTRVQYTATEVVDNTYPKKYIHAPRR